MRDDEERAEARRSLSFLHALRVAIPASLDDGSETKAAYQKFERELITKSNGAPPAEKKPRYSASKTNNRKPARRAPKPA